MPGCRRPDEDELPACDDRGVEFRAGTDHPLPAGRHLTRQIVIGTADWDAPEARQLREDQQSELRGLYGGDTEPGVKPSASDMTLFLLAWELRGDPAPSAATEQAEADPVGCGGLRQLDPTTAEIKRMYVRPTHRGLGLSRRILGELENRARHAGWSRLLLETGPAQLAAIQLYETSCYQRVDNFGAYRGNATSLCFERVLH